MEAGAAVLNESVIYLPQVGSTNAWAKENIAQNHLSDRITVNQGNLLDGTDGQADLIIANIIADIIILVLPEVVAKLRPQGRFLASGIIEERLGDVEKAAKEHGLTFLDVKRKAGWCAVTTLLYYLQQILKHHTSHQAMTKSHYFRELVKFYHL